MIASEGPPVDVAAINAAPILDVAAPALGPTLNWEPVPGLPPELQPSPGDILLSKAFWPWGDLGAMGIPENWLYMSRHVQGSIAMLCVQTPSGPRLVRGNADGSVVVSFPQGAQIVQFAQTLASGAHTSLISNVPGKIIYIFSYSIDMGENANAATSQAVFLLGDPSNQGVMLGGNNATRHWEQSFPVPHPLSPTDGLKITNGDSIAHNYVGTVEYLLA